MKLQAIKNAVTSRVGRQVLRAGKHSPVILFTVGVVGVVGAAVLASRATLKLYEILDDAHEDLEKIRTQEHHTYSEDDRRQDQVVVYARTASKIVGIYAPAVAVGALSIAA